MGRGGALALQPGDVAFSLGTSGTVYTVSESPTADATGAVAGFADATGRYLPLVCTLNATKVTDAIAGWLGVDHSRLDALALDAPPGAGGVVGDSLFRRRAHAEPARRLRNDRGPAHRYDPRATRARRRSRASCAASSTVSMRSRVLDFEPTATSCSSVAAPGRPRIRVLSPTSPDGRSSCPTRASTSPPVRACKAAAMLRERNVEDVAAEWKLGRGSAIEPDSSIDHAGVRGAYAAARVEGYRRVVPNEADGGRRLDPRARREHPAGAPSAA